MPKLYVWRDGCRVAPGTLRAYDLMRLDFERAFPGLTLKISSGTRTYEEQKAIFLARYVTAGNVRGRHVYDTRWWNGQLWYRISAAGTVAQPGTSRHENDRALDIRDTGNDPGVTRYGNPRSQWIRDNAHRYGFVPNGYTSFNEPWHIEFTGDPWFVPAGGGSEPFNPKPTPEPEPEEEEEEMLPKIIHRNTGGDEWSLVHPDLKGEREHERGYIVTTDPKRFRAWGRIWAKGGGSNSYAADVPRDEYIEIQAEAREAYDAARRAEADAIRLANAES